MLEGSRIVQRVASDEILNRSWTRGALTLFKSLESQKFPSALPLFAAAEATSGTLTRLVTDERRLELSSAGLRETNNGAVHGALSDL